MAVRAEGFDGRAEIADPQALLLIVGNAQLDALATEARQRLLRVLAVLEG